MSINYNRIIIAGTHSGVGKTTVAVGIMAALRKRGLKVQPFKTGPDYIDPTYHTRATGRISGNLDAWMLSRAAVLELFSRRAEDADISIIEGVMGLYDGLQGTQRGSTAALAKMLNAPVILVLNARSMSRSAAAIALGYREFDKNVGIAGIILNNIGSDNHYRYIKSAIEKEVRIPVLGYLPKDSGLQLPERHLGLIPVQEKKLSRTCPKPYDENRAYLRRGEAKSEDAGAVNALRQERATQPQPGADKRIPSEGFGTGSIFYQRLLKRTEKHINLDKILKISCQARALAGPKERIFSPKVIKERVRIAVARDEAFNFYYQDNLDILKHLGAKLVDFSPLKDKELPENINGLYFGGGFPELFAPQLSKNVRLKKEIYRCAKDGLPIYAECGGLIYLVERLEDFKKRDFPMVGIFKGSVRMGNRLQALGYVEAETVRDNILSKRGDKTKAHIFHWSYLKGSSNGKSFAYKIKKNGEKIADDGLVRGNVLASYAHLHFASNLNFAKNFIKSCGSG